MSKKGKIGFNPERKRYFVSLVWKGQRYYFSSYYGIPCFKEDIAKQLLAEIRGDLNRESFNPLKYHKRKPLRLRTYSETWLKKKEGRLSSATLKDYRNSLNNYILPALGDYLLEDINYDLLEDLQGRIPRSAKGKKNTMYCLYAILRDARRSGYISQMPERPQFTGEDAVIPPEIEYISPGDLDSIIDKIPLEDRRIFQFIRLTGCRPSEARALQWDCIKADHVLIRDTFGSDQELKVVKNRKPRKIPRYSLLDELIKSLPKNLSPYVFCNPRRTRRPYGRDFNRVWRKACEDAGLKVVPLRLCRHSFGCNLLDAGADIDLEDLRALYGHSDVRMTKRYAERSTHALRLKLDNVYNLEKNYKRLANK